MPRAHCCLVQPNWVTLPSWIAVYFPRTGHVSKEDDSCWQPECTALMQEATVSHKLTKTLLKAR